MTGQNSVEGTNTLLLHWSAEAMRLVNEEDYPPELVLMTMIAMGLQGLDQVLGREATLRAMDEMIREQIGPGVPHRRPA